MKVLTAFSVLFQCPKPILMLCCLTIGSCYILKPPINYVNTSSFDLSFQSTNENTLSFGDTLFLIKNDKSKPHYFFQRFSTGVCFDDKCRPLDITLYWNTTGRYLGFEMPEGEFLSKTDHDPFSKKEYLQLNEILCNTELPFKNIQYHELMNQPENTAESVDAISGATSEWIQDIVVKNAAYTTYKLWKLAYGESQKFIQQFTSNHLDAQHLLYILNSTNRQDIIWGLAHVKDTLSFSTPLKNRLSSLIQVDDPYLSYNAVHAIPKAFLNDSNFQETLFSSYLKTTDASTKNALVKKLKSAPQLSKKLLVKSRQKIQSMAPQEISSLLQLYKKQQINDSATLETVRALKNHHNAYVVNLAKDFLKGPEEKANE